MKMNDSKVSISSNFIQNQAKGNGFSVSDNSEVENHESTIMMMAKAFLTISEMTHKKLQKLCYYAKAWHLALYGDNIINEQFQAWVHGAVQPELYQVYKNYGFEKIPKLLKKDGIPEEFLSFAQEVYDSYGHLSGDELEVINHKEFPWINARKGYEPWEHCENVISEASMIKYYRNKIRYD